MESTFPSVFEFTNALEFLACLHGRLRQRNARFSLRAWAKKLGYQTPSYVSDVMRGERLASVELVQRVSALHVLSEEEQKYLELLVRLEQCKGPAEKEVILELLGTVHPSRKLHSMDVDQFRFLTDWYHLVILEMVDLDDFAEDPPAIARRLGRNISAAQVEASIERLLRLRLLQRNPDGQLKRPEKYVKIGDQAPARAIRQHQRQMLNIAEAVLEEQLTDLERYFSDSNFSVRMRDLPRAFAMIKKFRDQMTQTFTHKGEGADSVYHLSIQMFRIIDPTKGTSP